MQIGAWKFGISPINWVNEDVPELGDHFTFEDLMRDFQALGFYGTEMSRKFPQEPAELKKRLDEYGIELGSQWKGVRFADPSRREEQLNEYLAHVRFLQKMGSRHVVTCEIGGSPHADPEFPPDQKSVRRLKDEEWKHLADGLNAAGRICRDHGMKLVYHYHASTVVERPEEIERLMEETDPELVHLLFDTGHALYGGSEPLDLLKRYRKRIAYIHLKDVRPPVLERVRSGEIGFLQAVREGVFTVPGDGCIDFRPLFAELKATGYEGWMVIEAEQDPDKAPPVPYARRTIEYIREIVRSLNSQERGNEHG